MIARHHISPFFALPFEPVSSSPSLSPFQPMPYLLNPTSVTALNAKALPRQMIKVSSQFTLQCIDLMFPNLPGLSLMLPRTLRIFHSVPPLPAFLSLPLSLAACVCLQPKMWLTEMFLWSYLHMVSAQFKNIQFKNNRPDSKPRSNSYEDDHFKTTLLLQRNYWPSFTCCFKYCFRVNHPLVLIYHTSFAPHHLFICNSLLSRLLCFSDCHFPRRGCSEHFHVLFNYENLIWWKGVHGTHSYPCIIAHVSSASLLLVAEIRGSRLNRCMLFCFCSLPRGLQGYRGAREERRETETVTVSMYNS